MLYGPSFARAAVSAERLGINLASVQKAQESMVTNLDGTIDTIAQLNQLGANIDFGSLVTMAETQGPEATLRYLQSTIPPSLFQSASTRALISKLGIPLEDLLKRQGSVQESAADRIEQSFSEVAAPAGAVAQSLAKLNKDIKALEENKVMDILNGVVSVGKAIWGLFSAMIAFGAAVVQATLSLLGMSGGVGGAIIGLLTRLGGGALVAGGLYAGYKGITLGAETAARGRPAAGMAIATGAGAVGGLATGVGGAMLLGATIGSTVPIVGTILGATAGLIGAAILTNKKKKELEAQQRGLGESVRPKTPEAATKMDDGISRPGYGSRTLITPSKTYALNNNDNIIAYADDFDGTEVRPKGSIVDSVRSTAVDTAKTVAVNSAVRAAESAVGNVAGRMAINAVPIAGDVIAALLVAANELRSTSNLQAATTKALGYYAASAEAGLMAAGATAMTGPGALVAEAAVSAVAGEAFLRAYESANTRVNARAQITPKALLAAAGVTTEIAKNSIRAESRNIPVVNNSLEKSVMELIDTLNGATTTIQVGDTTRQVPRMSVARVGAYERFGRP